MLIGSHLGENMHNGQVQEMSDTMPMAITGWADVVLPECTYLERYDTIRDSAHRKPAVALRMPAAKPMYNSKPAYWMAKYNFRKGAGMALGGGAAVDMSASGQPAPELPRIAPRPKKKRVQGGC